MFTYYRYTSICGEYISDVFCIQKWPKWLKLFIKLKYRQNAIRIILKSGAVSFRHSVQEIMKI